MTHFAQIARSHAAVALIGAMAIAGLVAPAQASSETDPEQFAWQIGGTAIIFER
jgi:hypothetical protein